MSASVFFWIAGRRSRHIVLGRKMVDGICEHYGPGIDTVILSNRLFFVDETGQALKPWPASIRRIGFLSNITQEKGIAAFMELCSTVPINATIAGPAGNLNTQAAIDWFVGELPDRRSYLGPVYGEAKKDFFDSIDMLVFPTRYKNEAEPLVVYEALDRGIPVLATPMGCIPDQLPTEGVAPSVDEFVFWAAAQIAQWPAKAPQCWVDAFEPSSESLDKTLQRIVVE
ncbi:glycosyltransferase [Rhodopirellula islandica]|uniref:glycosyltransferase n=1 Tax=Rhodopirellula islandica TaxID=595434 RepID=UPI001364C3F3|nr:glycosyltransferase [Rhodopirellula islandica]